MALHLERGTSTKKHVVFRYCYVYINIYVYIYVYIYYMHIDLLIFLFNTASSWTIFRNKQPRHLKEIDSCRMLRGQKALSIDFILLNGFENHLLDDSELKWSTKNETFLLLVKPVIRGIFSSTNPWFDVWINRMSWFCITKVLLVPLIWSMSWSITFVNWRWGLFLCIFPMFLESIFIGSMINDSTL